MGGRSETTESGDTFKRPGSFRLPEDQLALPPLPSQNSAERERMKSDGSARTPATRFPLLTGSGCVRERRRTQGTSRGVSLGLRDRRGEK